MPDIVKTINSMKYYHKEILPIENLKLNQVRDTIVVCRVCRGERVIAVKSPVSHTFTFTKCYYCNGLGTMSNTVNCLDRR